MERPDRACRLSPGKGVGNDMDHTPPTAWSCFVSDWRASRACQIGKMPPKMGVRYRDSLIVGDWLAYLLGGFLWDVPVSPSRPVVHVIRPREMIKANPFDD